MSVNAGVAALFDRSCSVTRHDQLAMDEDSAGRFAVKQPVAMLSQLVGVRRRGWPERRSVTSARGEQVAEQ